MQHYIIKQMVKKMLENHSNYEWSLQGFGMLRTYISKELRMHIWDSRFAFEDVSEIHDHPWNFESLIVAGKVKNIRYIINNDILIGDTAYKQQLIKCGEGGCEVGEPKLVGLIQHKDEIFTEGYVYRQQANEIHQSIPEDGTITIIRREFLEDQDHAHVYYPNNEEWVTAEPRVASTKEIMDVCNYSLSKWF